MKKQVRFISGRHPLDDQSVQAAFAMAKERGIQMYLVGGCIRDAIETEALAAKGIPAKTGPFDFDFAIKSNALDFARAVADQLAGHYVVLDAQFDIARVVLESGNYLDFAGYKGSMQEDLMRRDLTINALALDGSERDQITDLVGGLEDLESNTIRAISESALQEDPLRLLRVYRFAVAREGLIESQTRDFVKNNMAMLAQVAPERINYEFFTLMDKPNAGSYIHEMGAIGLLEAVYPELKDCRRVTANSFHHLALFDHSLETVPQLEAKLPTLPAYFVESVSQPMSYGVTRLAATKVASLLHDIGKPGTWEVQPDGRHSFIGHDKLGAEMIRPLAQRAKWPRALSKLVEKLVLWHLRPGQLFHTGEPTVKALNRFYRNVGEDFAELMLLAFADFGSTRGPGLTGDKREALSQSLHSLVDGYPAYLESIANIPKLLGGADVMELLGIGPGPIVGEILNALSEAQEFKEVTDAAQAEAFVRSYWDSKKC